MSEKKAESPMAGVAQPEIVAPTPKANDEQAPVHDAEVFLVMEKRDEAQIVAALEGRYIEEFVYEFMQGGKKVVGLSWIGIQEASREYGGIQCPVDKMILEESDTEISVTLEAYDIKTGSIRIGHSTQPKKMRLTSGKYIDDAFAKQKAISKGQRNAIRPLLPQTLLKQWIEKHRIGGEDKPAPSPPKEDSDTGLRKELGKIVKGFFPDDERKQRQFVLACSSYRSNGELVSGKESIKALKGGDLLTTVVGARKVGLQDAEKVLEYDCLQDWSLDKDSPSSEGGQEGFEL